MVDYEHVAKEVASLIETEPDVIANFANVSALLYETLNKAKGNSINWLGFYRVNNAKESCLLGPFQGKVACIRIPFGSGVVGTCAKRRETIVVADVEKFPGHIACDSASKSEIVVPVFDANNELIAVLDIDAAILSCFSEDVDKQGLELCMKSFRRPKPPTPESRRIKHAANH